jgi:hypothetical protein
VAECNSSSNLLFRRGDVPSVSFPRALAYLYLARIKG